jgi:hypothetical protein
MMYNPQDWPSCHKVCTSEICTKRNETRYSFLKKYCLIVECNIQYMKQEIDVACMVLCLFLKLMMVAVVLSFMLLCVYCLCLVCLLSLHGVVSVVCLNIG